MEDIIDTGNTLSRLVALMQDAGAASVRVAALLDKQARRKVQVDADYVGFMVGRPNHLFPFPCHAFHYTHVYAVLELHALHGLSGGAS